MSIALRRVIPVLGLVVTGLGLAAAADGPMDVYISTGDNHWLGESLPIDSPASIEASFTLFKRLGVRRVYWRGLEEATWLEVMHARPEMCRYYSNMLWMRELYKTVQPDKLAVEAAHKRGMEIWGVGTLWDWGAQADAPGSGEYPHCFEARFRIEHPQWIPTDRSGLLKQGGGVELAYPEARKTLVDLHAGIMKRDGYDGMVFLTYVENFSTRFEDEFGFNEPIVTEFKKRTGVDLRKQPFARFASKPDWRALRGEFVTQYLRELRAALSENKQQLGLFINPFDLHQPQPWNVSDIHPTAGSIHMDVETWLRERLVDQLIAYGNCNPLQQRRALDQLSWLVRQTSVTLAGATSNPFAEHFKPYRQQGVAVIFSVNEDHHFVERGGIPEQPPESLKSSDFVLRLRVLAQIAEGKLKATVDQVTPLTRDSNLLVRRQALRALGKMGDPATLPVIEAALDDPENGVRCMAARALRDLNGPQSCAAILRAVERHDTFPLRDIAVVSLFKFKSPPREQLAKAMLEHANVSARQVAARALAIIPNTEVVSALVAALKDSDRFVRYSAAVGLGNVPRSTAAAEALLAALSHEDPVVANRAATSLANTLARNLKEIEPYRERALAALTARYEKVAGDPAAPDAQWGYRPVGNALLKLGPAGELVLSSFMKGANPRLAERAWRSLVMHQDVNRFDLVTEKEYEQQVKLLPDLVRAAAR